jgi:putative addiction module component (TIGR02574 family)
LGHDLFIMAPALSLLETALLLPEEDRAELALRLVESLEAGKDTDAEEAWAQVIVERVKALQAGRAKTIPLDVAMAQARAQLHVRRG